MQIKNFPYLWQFLVGARWLVIVIFFLHANEAAARPFQKPQSDRPSGANSIASPKGKGNDAAEVTRVETLFDGKTLGKWETTEFGGEGDCRVTDGVIEMLAGDPFTGINLPEDFDLPHTDYEIEVTAKKIEGTDFFCTVTFPVADSFCSLVVGGWGGSLVGLSCIDDQDASENDTRLIRKFERNRWYNVRIRVRPERIVVWIDGKEVINKNIQGKKVSLRSGVIPCRPLGICSFITTAAIKKIELKHLKSESPKK